MNPIEAETITPNELRVALFLKKLINSIRTKVPETEPKSVSAYTRSCCGMSRQNVPVHAKKM